MFRLVRSAARNARAAVSAVFVGYLAIPSVFSILSELAARPRREQKRYQMFPIEALKLGKVGFARSGSTRAQHAACIARRAENNDGCV